MHRRSVDPELRAALATAPPAAIWSIASRRWWAESFFGRPKRTPGAFGALPAFAGADQPALELGEVTQDGEWPAAIIVAATCVRHNGHRGRSSALLLG
jgi:hypothetical protein